MRTLDEILNGENLDEFLLKCRLNPKLFMDRVLGWKYKAKPFHIDWFNMFKNNKRSVVVAFRGSGKTETLGVAFFLWLALYNRDKHMVVVSKTKDMSKEIIKRVKEYISNNELLLTLKPDTASLTWTKSEIETTTGCRLLSRPYGDNIRSWHVHYLLADEVAFYDDKSYFYSALLPTVNAHNGNLMVISTPNNFTDLIAELSKKPMYSVAYYPAEKDGKVLWPERFSREKLSKIRSELGDVKYNREYLLKVISEETALIPIDKIEAACDDNLSMKSTLPEDEEVYFGADFAISATGNYSAFTVVKKIGNKFQVVYLYRPPRGTDSKTQEVIIKDIYNRFNIISGYGDRGSFGSIIVENLITSGINIIGFDFQNKREQLLVNLVKKFNNNQIIIPTNPEDPYTKSMSDVLIKELSEMSIKVSKTGKEVYKTVGAHDDTVMSLALAIWAADEIQPIDAMIEAWSE